MILYKFFRQNIYHSVFELRNILLIEVSNYTLKICEHIITFNREAAII